jgi:hypothetical protein
MNIHQWSSSTSLRAALVVVLSLNASNRLEEIVSRRAIGDDHTHWRILIGGHALQDHHIH